MGDHQSSLLRRSPESKRSTTVAHSDQHLTGWLPRQRCQRISHAMITGNPSTSYASPTTFERRTTSQYLRPKGRNWHIVGESCSDPGRTMARHLSTVPTVHSIAVRQRLIAPSPLTYYSTVIQIVIKYAFDWQDTKLKSRIIKIHSATIWTSISQRISPVRTNSDFFFSITRFSHYFFLGTNKNNPTDKLLHQSHQSNLMLSSPVDGL